jgi:hypothetical protein
MKRTRTPEEILAAVEDPSLDEALDAEMERVLAMTPEQRHAELAAAGFDVKELHAEADVWAEKMKHTAVEDRKKDLVTEARAKSLRPPPRRRPAAVLLAATLGAATVGGAALAYVHWGAAPSPVTAPSAPPSTPTAPTPPPSALPVAARAAKYRERALAACQGHMWQPCLEDLDRARELDPAGESDPAVQAARQEAERWLTPEEKPERLK